MNPKETLENIIKQGVKKKLGIKDEYIFEEVRVK